MADQELRNSLSALAQVVDKSSQVQRSKATSIDLLDDVINRISRVTGSRAVSHDQRIDATNWVQTRIESTGVRTRVVSLTSNDWFKRSTLCMVGFTKETSQPVALIPSIGAYRIYDPATGSVQKVTSSMAATLANTAYLVYPSFAAGPITLRSILKLLRSQLSGQIRVIFALGLLAAVISLVTPIMIGLIFNQVLPNQQPVLLVGVGILLAGAAVTTAVVNACSSLASTRLIGRLEAIDESAMMDRIMSLPSSFIRGFSTGDLGARITGLQQIRNKALTIVLSSGLAAVMSTISLGLLFLYSPKLAVVALCVLAVLLVLVTLINLRRVRQERDMLDQAGKVDSAVFEWVRSIPKIQVAGAERRIMTHWSHSFAAQQSLGMASGRTAAWSSAILAALTATLALVLYLFAGYFLAGELEGGSYLAFYSALGQFTAAVVGLTATLGPIVEIAARWKRLEPIFAQEQEQFGTQSPGTLTGAIKVSQASFAYTADSSLVLRDIELDVQPGEFVAIVGASGCGKSTLVRLILGLDRPDTGSVIYDGIDLSLLDVRQVRGQLGVVIQNARPLPGEILATILGESDGGEELAWQAAEVAGIAADIRAMPMKMKTLMGEGAASFSGGQVQRLMIARAIARKPRILIFDEATSALDDRTQKQVVENIEQLNITRIVIAHRLSTVRNADKIVVMESGQIVDQGTFAELMSRPSVFREMASRQLLDE